MKYSIIPSSISMLIFIFICQLSKTERQHETPFKHVNLCDVDGLTLDCLDCICNDFVGENCNINEICGHGEKCDLLDINYRYYQQICTTGPNIPVTNYVACKNDPTCAGLVVVETLKNYIKKIPKTNSMTCEEFLLIHQYDNHEHYLVDNRRYRLNKCIDDRSRNYANKSNGTCDPNKNEKSHKYCQTKLIDEQMD